MRVLIHALAWRDWGGSDRHMRGLLKGLGQGNQGDEYIVCIDSGFRAPKTWPNCTFRPMAIRSTWRRLLWDQFRLPAVGRRENADAVWDILGFGSYHQGMPQIVFLEDARYYCDPYLATASLQQRIDALIRRRIQWLSLRVASRIVTPTVAMMEMVKSKHPHIPAERFQVIPLAYDPSEMSDAEPLPASVQEAVDLARQTGLVILYVGHILPYKQLDLLLEAFSRVQGLQGSPSTLLLTIAREDWPLGYDRFVKAVKAKGLAEQVFILGKVPQLAMGRLYRACDLLAYPSLCESFGWPLLEGTSLGIPILAADTPVNRELAGPGALYFPTGDVDAATCGLRQLLGDQELRAQMGQAGHGHFQSTHLGWDTYVGKCLAATVRQGDDT